MVGNSLGNGRPSRRGGRRQRAAAPQALSSSIYDAESSENYHDDNNNNESSLTFTLAEWMDNCGMDLFGCDENCDASRKVLGAALRLQQTAAEADVQPGNDYVALHDEFLEALQYEQQMRRATNAPVIIDDDDDDDDDDDTTTADLSVAAVAPEPEQAAIDTADEDDSSPPSGGSSAPSPRKRRRPIKLHRHRHNSPGRRHRHQALQQYHSQRRRSGGSRVAPLIDAGNAARPTPPTTTLARADSSASKSYPKPSSYLHMHCRMQKDKGKGEPVGSLICAKGRDACLEKLEAKMQLIDQYVHDKKGMGVATMQRRGARISAQYDNFVETRSLIELQMGLYKMTYGVLLRWDTGGKVTLVVLRKQCKDSFYPARSLLIADPTPPPPYKLPPRSLSPVQDVIGEKHAVLQREHGMEVALLDPPYRIEKPLKFGPNVLMVSVEYMVGLSPNSDWTVKLGYEGHQTNIPMVWNPAEGQFRPTKAGAPLKQTIKRMDLSPLEVMLFEHRNHRQANRRLITALTVPLAALSAQPSSKTNPTTLVCPFDYDDDALIALGLCFSSDYAHWLTLELDARRKEEVSNFSWKAPFKSTPVVNDENHSPEDEQNPWDWICSVC